MIRAWGGSYDLILQERSEKTRKDSVGEALCFFFKSIYIYWLIHWLSFNLMRSHPYLRGLQLLHQSHAALPSLSSLFRTSNQSLSLHNHYFPDEPLSHPQRFVLFCSDFFKILSFVSLSESLPLSYSLCVCGLIFAWIVLCSDWFVVSLPFLSLHLFGVIDEIMRNFLRSILSESDLWKS